MLLNLPASNRTDRGAIRPCNGLNTPLFCHSRMAKILEIDRSIRLSNFPPKSHRKGIVSPLQLFFPADTYLADSCIHREIENKICLIDSCIHREIENKIYLVDSCIYRETKNKIYLVDSYIRRETENKMYLVDSYIRRETENKTYLVDLCIHMGVKNET